MLSGTGVFEGLVALLWKIAEWVVGWLGTSALDRYRRFRIRRDIRASSGQKITILLAKIDGDTDANSHRKTLHETIRRELGAAVTITLWPEALPNCDGHEYDSEHGAYATAQKWLANKRCDFLIAGREKGRNAAGETILSLQFIVADIGHRPSESYKLSDTLDLPVKFISDLGVAISARVVTSLAPTIEMRGQYLVPLMRVAAERLKPIIKRLNPSFDADTRGALLHNYALVKSTIGEQAGSNDDLAQAISSYRAALLERTRARVPLDWAMTQNNLGTALRGLGERESSAARLEEAVAAYRAALMEYTRARVPFVWAGTQNNLGNALLRLGERESNTARLEEAVEAFRAALLEWTRARVPLQWASTQNNLGAALSALGERVSGTARFDEAVAAYREALKEYTRERVPLQWAATQSNLGLALATLGERESGTAQLDEAVAAYREALKEYTRERVPLDWASTQNNLGLALTTLGKRANGTARLDEAVAVYRASLLERTRERVPLDWAITQNNLGLALATLGEHAGGTARLDEAVAAYRAALEVFKDAKASYYIDLAKKNLARVEAQLAERRANNK